MCEHANISERALGSLQVLNTAEREVLAAKCRRLPGVDTLANGAVGPDGKVVVLSADGWLMEPSCEEILPPPLCSPSFTMLWGRVGLF